MLFVWLFLLLSGSCAFARPLSEGAIKRALAKCEQIKDANSTIQDLKRDQCTLQVQIKMAKRLDAKDKTKIKDDLREWKKQLKDLESVLVQLDSAVSEKAAGSAVTSVQRPLPVARTTTLLGLYVATTWDAQRWEDQLCITGLKAGGGYAFNSISYRPINTRLVVLKNGQPLAIQTPSGPMNEQIHVDEDGDQQADSLPIQALDTQLHDQVCFQRTAGDSIVLAYYKASDLVLEVDGMPPQKVWKPLRQGKVYVEHTSGRWQIPAYSAF